MQLSFARTRGYWGKIFGNSFLFGLILMFVTYLLVFFLAFALTFVVHLFLGATDIPKKLFTFLIVTPVMAVQQMITIVGIFFTVQLATTILENPRSATVKEA